MFSWLRSLSGGKKKGMRASGASVKPPIDRQKLVATLDDLIKTPGKACYRTLVDLSHSCSKDEFIYFVHCPAFVGSGIHDGNLERAVGGMSGKSQKTQTFNAAEVAKLIEGASLEQSIFLLRKPVLGQLNELRRFTLGRTQDNDILMMDFAISRLHAEVEIRGEDYYLKDMGSSNGTFVNGNLIDDRGLLLQDGDRVRFARYEFLFLSAGGLYSLMKRRAQDASAPPRVNA